jgi:predicted AAA+ superfamily ATPase
MEQLFEISYNFISSCKDDFKRSLYNEINWEGRLIEIFGARGVGKTTLILQYAKSKEGKQKMLYCSLDDPFFYKESIVDTADKFVKYGGELLLLDEVHKYPSKDKSSDWSAELKVIYDRYPELLLVYTGSSALQIKKGLGDLSRRKTAYHLPGLSFREFLIFNNLFEHRSVNIEEIVEFGEEITKKIKSEIKVLPYFEDYLKNGYFPFYTEDKNNYFQKLNNTINAVLEHDIPIVGNFNSESSIKMKKLLALLSECAPFTPNLSSLKGQLFIADQRTLLNYLNALEYAELISTLSKNSSGLKSMHKPDKIYLNNTNYLFSLPNNLPNKGLLRETFFLNQIKQLYDINYPGNTDFYVDNRYYFEVGGKNKNKKQIETLSNAYIAKDDIEIGFGNVIPLWLFGFLY